MSIEKVDERKVPILYRWYVAKKDFIPYVGFYNIKKGMRFKMIGFISKIEYEFQYFPRGDDKPYNNMVFGIENIWDFLEEEENAKTK